MLEITLNWFTNHYIEFLGTIFGLIYIVFSIKQNILLWPVGIITSALYIYVFFYSKFYADMSLQVYYLFISIYGWHNWLHGKNKNTETNQIQITRATKKLSFILILTTFILFVFMAFILKNYTDSPLPYWDSFTTSASIVATWMLTKKYIEQWIIWVIVDAVSLGLYIYKGLYSTSFLFIFYTIMAIIGYFEWKKEMNKTELALSE
ncbi:MAG: nicotinamide mononucleotide transporter [Bacteroidetes bacterium]|nr:nicotinamide mononucleotide transporter [Bacteroidota bacterium]